MNFRTSLLCFFAFIILKLDLFSKEQDIQFTHLSADDGLSANVVTQILQDNRGFLWFGTYNGLNRFDGYNFKVFLPNPINPKSISNHAIWSIFQDSKGILWVGTVDGLNRYDWKTEEFFRYKNNPRDSNSISNNFINTIFEDKSGTLWIGTINGLNKYNRGKDNFTVIKKVSDKLNNFSNSVNTIDQDYEGNLWIGTWNSKVLTCLQKDGNIVFKNLPEIKNPDPTLVNDIKIIKLDNAKNIWIGTTIYGLFKYDLKTNKFFNYRSLPANINSISDNFITKIFQDKHNNIWIGTKNGLNKFDQLKNRFIKVLHYPIRITSICNNNILSISEDNSGILWIGTAEGISKTYQVESKFNYFKEFQQELNLSSGRINSLSVDRKDNVWIGTEKGLYQIKNSTNSSESKAGKIIRYIHKTESKNSLNDNFIWSVITDHLGYVWIGTSLGGLNRYNPLTGEFKAYMFNENDTATISNNGVISLCEDHNGNIWAGTWWGFNFFDRKKEKFTRYLDKFKSNQIPVIYEDSKGMIWIGSDGSGLCLHNPTTNSFKSFIHDSSSTNKLSNNRIYSIFESNDGMMWFGTTEGLNSYDRITGKFTIYNKKNGIVSALINNIQEDNKGNIWISTDKGLSKFDRKTRTFYNFSTRSGIQYVEFINNVSGKFKNGNLILGDRNSITVFNPDSIKNEYIMAPVVFTDLKIYNQSVPISADGNSVLKESISITKSISIPSNNYVITLEFALMDYFDVRKNKFSYKLIGFDTDWNEVGNRNNATYTNLPPGNYTFILKAFNSDGIKNLKEASIKIIIVPELYQTWWFKTLIVISIIFSSIFVLQYRTRKIKRQNKMLEKYVAERTKDLDETIKDLSREIIERKRAEEKVQASLEEKEILLKEIHHRVKNNLQVISSLLSLQSKKVKDSYTIDLFNESQNRIKTMALIHEKLYQSKDFAEIGFDEYVKSLVEHLSHSFKKDGLGIKTTININKINLTMDTAVSCGLIVNELMTNAYKYAFPSTWIKNKTENYESFIKISIKEEEENKFLLIVNDNGIGIPENFNIQHIDSLGLKIVSSMVDQLNGSIEILRNNGTEIRIKFTDIK